MESCKYAGQANQANCKDALEAGNPACQIAFFMIQSHHDYCPHDTLTYEEEEAMHDWEDYCLRCEISRGYDSNLGDCPSIDCTDTNDAEAVYDLLNAECTKGSSGSCCTTTAQQTAC